MDVSTLSLMQVSYLLPSFLDACSLSMSTLGCKALYIVRSFLFPWSIYWISSLVHFKNGPEYFMSGTAQEFIPLMRFLVCSGRSARCRSASYGCTTTLLKNDFKQNRGPKSFAQVWGYHAPPSDTRKGTTVSRLGDAVGCWIRWFKEQLVPGCTTIKTDLARKYVLEVQEETWKKI